MFNYGWKKGKNSILVREDKNKLNIFGDADLVNSIYGEGMLEKVYIPPVVSSEDIINKCDKWIEMFKKVHDVFKKLVLSEKYRKQGIVMELSFTQFFSFTDSNIKGNSIDLDLKRYGDTIQEGVTISVDEINSDIYAYLMANVISYYISKNYNDTNIDYLDFSWNNTLFSNIKTQKFEIAPIMTSLSSLYDSLCYSRIVKSILGSHNLGIPTDQIISNLRNKISSQQISDEIDRLIDYSSRQCEFIVKDSEKEKQAVYKKKSPTSL